jgi:hypothetical protein
LNHGATLSSLRRGRAVADTAFLDNSSLPWPAGYREQGSYLSSLGSGDITNAHFMLPGKLILDWLPESAVPQLDTTAGCAPCGRYLLQPTDTGVIDFSSGANPAGVRIATGVPGRYFWVEVRTAFTSGVPSVVVSSASFSDTQGRGGMVGITMLADTALADPVRPFVAAGKSLVLDLGSSGSPQPLQLRVAAAGAQVLEVVFETPGLTSPSPSPPPPLTRPPPPSPPDKFFEPVTKFALNSCSTTLSRRAPLDPVVNSPSACLGTEFTTIGSYGSSRQCQRAHSAALLHFKLPDGITAAALESAKLSFYVANALKGPGVRLDGLGTRSGDQLAALALQTPGDFHIGGTDSSSSVTEIDPLAMRWNTPTGTFEYETPALTAYVRSQIAAGGAGKHLVLRLSARWWYGCLNTACNGCEEKQYTITRASEKLTLTGAFSGLVLPRTSGVAELSMDPAALTEQFAEALAAMGEGKGEVAGESERNAHFISTPLGVGVLAASAALAVAAVVLVTFRRHIKRMISPWRSALSHPAVRRRTKMHSESVVPAHDDAAATGAQLSA